MAAVVSIDERVFGYQQEMRAVEQILGQALGYPWYKDDPDNWPDATVEDGVCVGEHTPYTMAKEAAQVILALATQLRKEAAPRTLAGAAPQPSRPEPLIIEQERP